MKVKIYDSAESLELTLEGLKGIFGKAGATQLLFKQLAPNDNSKNQPYLASHISELSFLPSGDISKNRLLPKKRQTLSVKSGINHRFHFHGLMLTGTNMTLPAHRLFITLNTRK